MYRAAIFDVDGTLVDSNDAHAEAWVRALADHGRRVEFSRVRPLIGMGGDKLLLEVAGIDVDSAEGRAIDARRREFFLDKLVPHLRPTRGARELLEWLRDQRLRLAVATSAQKEELHALLRVARVSKLFGSTTSSDDADRSKPDPDIVRAALGRTGCAPAEAVMIGDTPYDVQAAARAGIDIVALRCGGWSDHDLAGAIAIYADPADLLEHYDLSPFTTPAPLRSA